MCDEVGNPCSKRTVGAAGRAGFAVEDVDAVDFGGAIVDDGDRLVFRSATRRRGVRFRNGNDEGQKRAEKRETARRLDENGMVRSDNQRWRSSGRVRPRSGRLGREDERGETRRILGLRLEERQQIGVDRFGLSGGIPWGKSL